MSDSPAVLARVRDPKHAGWMNREAPDVGTGEAASADGVAMTRIQVRVDGETQRIEEAVFKVVGSSAAIASASLVSERLHGAAVAAVKDLDGFMIVAELQLPMERANVAGLAVEAAKRAVADWQKKRPDS